MKINYYILYSKKYKHIYLELKYIFNSNYKYNKFIAVAS